MQKPIARHPPRTLIQVACWVLAPLDLSESELVLSVGTNSDGPKVPTENGKKPQPSDDECNFLSSDFLCFLDGAIFRISIFHRLLCVCVFFFFGGGIL